MIMELLGITKVTSLGPDTLGEYELAKNPYSREPHEPLIAKVGADEFIYWYESGSYDGSGVAVWVKDGKWAYQWLGHCSCNGPCEDIQSSDKAKFELEDIIKIIANDYSWKDLSTLVSYLKENYLKDDNNN